jgi:chromosomal replication initiator protein
VGADPSERLGPLWQRVCEDLAASMPSSTYELWIAPLRPVSVRGSNLYLSAPDTIRTWVERRYSGRIARALRQHSPDLESVALVSPRDGPERQPSPPAGVPAPAPEPTHTFDRFVIGRGNRLAHAAALAVAELPGDAYNPLLLHGPPGLGKTHLLGAIASYLHRHHPSLTVHYTTAERFTAEFVTALRHDGPDRFKARYRELDALLIDDVQVLEGKDRTQEEFVHTFNALHSAGKQIVLSSDRPPAALSRLETRLRDRFQWGLCVALDPPDLRTRLALTWRLAAQAGSDAPTAESLSAIASHASSNVRLLEGAVTRVLAFSSLLGESLQPSLVDRALGTRATAAPVPTAPSIAAIQDATCSVLGITRQDMLSPRRTPAVARARQLAMYVAREQTGASLTEIAREFDRDHTTVVHALRTVASKLEPGSDLAENLSRVRTTLGERSDPNIPSDGGSPHADP